jgi:cytochrome b
MANNSIKVWDLPVRIFHWSLVAFFTVAYFTGEEESQWHIYSGYVVLGLVLLRILWGFVGNRHARFSDFIYAPGSVSAYIKSLGSAAPKRYLGHTPPGGWMILALLASLLLTTLSGLQVYGLEGQGPLAANPASSALISSAYANDEKNGHENDRHDNEAEETWEEIHEVLSNLTVLLIFIHIGGVLASSRLHKENLVKAMFTGRKERTDHDVSA